jgi:hypothetical protein
VSYADGQCECPECKGEPCPKCESKKYYNTPGTGMLCQNCGYIVKMGAVYYSDLPPDIGIYDGKHAFRDDIIVPMSREHEEFMEEFFGVIDA